MLDEVLVTPSRYAVDAWKVGATVHTLTSEDIERLGTPSVREILNTQPGLRTSANGRLATSQSLFVRGIPTTGSKVLVDGIPQSYGFNSTFFYLNPQDIERIEIIKGGVGTFYGADTFGGVINIITKKNRAKPLGVDFNFEGGSFSTFTESLRLHGYLKGLLLLSLRLAAGFSRLVKGKRD